MRLVEYAHRRHWIEQYDKEAKTELGWGQYQGRRWAGFHPHAVWGMLAYNFKGVMDIPGVTALIAAIQA